MTATDVIKLTELGVQNDVPKYRIHKLAFTLSITILSSRANKAGQQS